MKTYSLHIYPLNTVVCPNGLVSLKITKASYIEKIIRSKDQARLGLVTKLNESDCEHDLGFPFASTGTSVKIIKTKIDVEGSMFVQGIGQHRIKLHSCIEDANGLFLGEVSDIDNDQNISIPEDLQLSSNVLNVVLKSIPVVKNSVVEPYELESASWVSNRWLEILSLPAIEKQRLMELNSPIIRLELIQDILDKAAHNEFLNQNSKS